MEQWGVLVVVVLGFLFYFSEVSPTPKSQGIVPSSLFLLLTPIENLRGFLKLLSCSVIRYTELQNSVKAVVCLIREKGCKLEPTERGDTVQSAECRRRPHVKLLVILTHGLIALPPLGHAVWQYAQRTGNQRSLPRLLVSRVFTGAQSQTPCVADVCLQPLLEVRLIPLVSSSSGGQNWNGMAPDPHHKSCC